MGRHSVAVDDDEDDVPVAEADVTAVATRPRPGRHSRPDEDSEPDAQTTDPMPVVGLTKPLPGPVLSQLPGPFTEPLPGLLASAPAAPQPPTGAEAPAPRPQPAPKRESPTARDVALFRDHPDVRNRAIAAALVPFVIYTAVMLATGRASDYLIWIFIPLIVAGVLVGLMLDLGHKKYGSQQPKN